jgi:hypothetical protein
MRSLHGSESPSRFNRLSFNDNLNAARPSLALATILYNVEHVEYNSLLVHSGSHLLESRSYDIVSRTFYSLV